MEASQKGHLGRLVSYCNWLSSRYNPRKLAAKAPENWWSELKDYFPFGSRWLFRGELLNFGGVFGVTWCLMSFGTATFSRTSQRAPDAAYSKNIWAQDLERIYRFLAEFWYYWCSTRQYRTTYCIYSSSPFQRISGVKYHEFTLMFAVLYLIYPSRFKAFKGTQPPDHFITNISSPIIRTLNISGVGRWMREKRLTMLHWSHFYRVVKGWGLLRVSGVSLSFPNLTPQKPTGLTLTAASPESGVPTLFVGNLPCLGGPKVSPRVLCGNPGSAMDHRRLLVCFFKVTGDSRLRKWREGTQEIDEL